ncbi:MAG: hypothetical protein FJ041_07950, partial [Candidatus Cloacimonetes bacterium]|nr:hypothetical protein [Candidatus Cloacimonadota bacterium]
MKIKLFILFLCLVPALVFCGSVQELTGQNVIPVSVSVTGDVKKPGVYILTTMNRVSEAL